MFDVLLEIFGFLFCNEEECNTNLVDRQVAHALVQFVEENPHLGKFHGLGRLVSSVGIFQNSQ